MADGARNSPVDVTTRMCRGMRYTRLLRRLNGAVAHYNFDFPPIAPLRHRGLHQDAFASLVAESSVMRPF